jgi:flagellar secretion chaperone FliS
MTSPAMRARYLNDSIATASPARLLVMLYERLVVDLSQAETAFVAGDRTTADERLKHAQEIVIELRASLRLDLWSGATDLARIYGFLLGELISANIRADVEKVVSCRKLVEPLLDAWRQASLIAAEPAA